MTRDPKTKTRSLAGALALAALVALAALATAAPDDPAATAEPPANTTGAAPTGPVDADPATEKVPPIPRRVEEVVVQAVRADADTPVTKTDVPRAEIERKNLGQEMPALLADLPAMTYYSDTGLGNGYSYVSMRGIGPTRINFTLDGVPLNEPEDGTL
ncbi:MAG TPA: Plug domain-containing protein, partial [Thermoanaerobaculia bacterium]|nr:Plug domain-containing protein [Thermoanaerobaculia bacterium]